MTRPTIQQLNEAVAAETARCAQVCVNLFDLRADQRARHVAAMCADAIRSSAKQSIESKAARLAAVTDEAIAAFNASRLVKVNGGLLRSVSATVGRTNRQSQIKRCVKIASEIWGGPLTREFWDQYFAICHGDDFLSGRRESSGEHAGWKPDMEYLTRAKTMLKVYEKSEAV